MNASEFIKELQDKQRIAKRGEGGMSNFDSLTILAYIDGEPHKGYLATVRDVELDSGDGIFITIDVDNEAVVG